MSVNPRDPALAVWRSSSHSAGQGQCVEVGTWRTSSYSAGQGQCVEVGGWRKSSHSTGEGQCVEVATSVDAVGVRDTKNRAAGHFAVRPATWRTFAHAVAHGTLR